MRDNECRGPALCRVMEPHYPKAGGSRPPMAHRGTLQHWTNHNLWHVRGPVRQCHRTATLWAVAWA